MGDIQIAAEYVAYAIKTLFKAAGRKINVVGHSQGGTNDGVGHCGGIMLTAPHPLPDHERGKFPGC